MEVNLPIAILAGGLATRLHPLTQTIPKALVEVAGHPFIYYQLEYLKSQGLKRVVLCTGFLGEMIQDMIGSGAEFGLDISYSTDGPTLLGTGGALKKALPMLGKAFFVLYGDSFLPINFGSIEKAYTESKKPALMTVFENNDNWDKSNVCFQNGELIEYNKNKPGAEMTFIDYGLSVISSKVLDSYSAGQEFDLSEIYQVLSREGRLAGYQVNERFYEIGSREGLKETEKYFLERDKV